MVSFTCALIVCFSSQTHTHCNFCYYIVSNNSACQQWQRNSDGFFAISIAKGAKNSEATMGFLNKKIKMWCLFFRAIHMASWPFKSP
jgi:hypothetical protein